MCDKIRSLPRKSLKDHQLKLARILDIKKHDKELIGIVMAVEGSDGLAEPALIPMTELNQHYPQDVIGFYESRIVWQKLNENNDKK